MELENTKSTGGKNCCITHNKTLLPAGQRHIGSTTKSTTLFGKQILNSSELIHRTRGNQSYKGWEGDFETIVTKTKKNEALLGIEPRLLGNDDIKTERPNH